jgi:Origin of replication binding protein
MDGYYSDNNNSSDEEDEQEAYFGNYRPYCIPTDSFVRSNELTRRLKEQHEFLEYERLVDSEKSVYVNRCQRLFRNNVKSFAKLKAALEYLCKPYRGPSLHIFALPKPVPNAKGRLVKQVKQYWVGSHERFFAFASDENVSVLLEECIISVLPMPLFFDIEIKQIDEETLQSLLGRDWVKVLLCHCKNIQSEVAVDAKLAKHKYYMYRSVAVWPFTDDECKAGLVVILDFVESFLLERLHVTCNFNVVSGCRSNKLSFHLVTKDLLVDSTIKSMPLLVFEIAREFQFQNLKFVMSSERLDVSIPEIRFRVRAMMLFQLVHFNDDGMNNGPEVEDFTFRILDDSVFDESVYSVNHLLRAPGSCKVNTSALHPVDRNSSVMIKEERTFRNVFSPDDVGYKLWEKNLVTGQVGDMVPCLVGMKPSNAYPRSRSWISNSNKEENGRLEGSGCNNIINYQGPLFVDRRREIYRPVRRIAPGDYGNLLHRLTYSDIDNAREIVQPDEIFLGEDHVRKPFRLFRVNDWIFHRHGGVDERTASAKVFRGGFRCFGCNKTYILPRDTPFEEPFMFTGEEVTKSEDPREYMPDVDWDLVIGKKKITVINAPMGSGKTEQLMKLVEYLDENEVSSRLLVISFRELLARQQSSRLGIVCYKDCSLESLVLGPRQVSICLNSITKLPGIVYDYIVLDECGLIRRHFLSATIQQVQEVYDWFKTYMERANGVILLQDGISTEDVRFFSEMCKPAIDPMDRQHVHCIEFKKPIVIHPIQMTLIYNDALINLVTCYKKSLGTLVTKGYRASEHPFMVFCTSCVMAEFIVTILREEAVLANANPDAIQGVWSQLKECSRFCQEFGKNPNEASVGIDVVVCTSVIGAGFSIDERFEAFHGFFVCGILQFEEERQFIQRLRYLLKNVPETAIRQSYLYVEKGRGSNIDYSKVLSSFASVRRLALTLHAQRSGCCQVVMENAALQNTAARIEVERTASRSMHDRLWKDYGDCVLESEFVEANWDFSDEEVNSMKARFRQYIQKRRKDISAHLLRLDFDDLSACVAELELSETFDIMRLADIKQIDSDIMKHFETPYLWDYLLGDTKEKLVSKSFRVSIVSQANGFICWLTYIYGYLVPDRLTMMYSNWNERRCDSAMMSRVSHFILAKEVLFPLFSVTEEEKRVSYLQVGACMPFMTGAEFVIDDNFVTRVREKFDVNVQDDDATKEIKELRRNAYMVLMHKCERTEACFGRLYDYNGVLNKQNRHNMMSFIKTVFKKIGLKVASTGKKRMVQSERRYIYVIQPPRLTFLTALCLKKSSKDRLLELLPILINTDNTSQHDKEWINDCIREYEQACYYTGHKSILNQHTSLGRMNIQQQLGVIPTRIAEERVYEAARLNREPIIGFDIEIDNINESNSSQSISYDTKSTEVTFMDDQDMISMEGITGEEQIAMANRNLSDIENQQANRLLQYATRRHGPAPVYKAEKPRPKCHFIDDAAVDDDDEDNEDDDDVVSHITEETTVIYRKRNKSQTNLMPPPMSKTRRSA